MWIFFAVPIANMNFHLLERSFDSIKMTWSAPARLVLYPNETDVLRYEIQIMKAGADEVWNGSVNGSTTEFSFKTKNPNDYCFFLNVCVTPARSAGLEETTECVQTSFERGGCEEREAMGQ